MQCQNKKGNSFLKCGNCIYSSNVTIQEYIKNYPFWNTKLF